MRLIIFIGLFVTLTTPSALADGGYVPKIAPGAYAQDITEPTQKAIIAHADGKERMVLQVSFKGKASEFVWLVPTPSIPGTTSETIVSSPMNHADFSAPAMRISDGIVMPIMHSLVKAATDTTAVATEVPTLMEKGDRHHCWAVCPPFF